MTAILSASRGVIEYYAALALLLYRAEIGSPRMRLRR